MPEGFSPRQCLFLPDKVDVPALLACQRRTVNRTHLYPTKTPPRLVPSRRRCGAWFFPKLDPIFGTSSTAVATHTMGDRRPIAAYGRSTASRPSRIAERRKSGMHRTLNPTVGGSIPSRPTPETQRPASDCGALSFWGGEKSPVHRRPIAAQSGFVIAADVRACAPGMPWAYP